MKHYRVIHRTTYDYGKAVVTSHNEARLSPRQLGRQAVGRSNVVIDPVPDTISNHRDYFGNGVTYFSLQRPHRRLTVTAESRVDIAMSGVPSDPCSTPPWEEVCEAVRHPLSAVHNVAAQFVLDSAAVRCSAALKEYARLSFHPRRPVLDAVIDLNRRIFTEFRYEPGATTVSTPVEEVFEGRRGVCQDFSHLMIGCLRSLGLPARYVSGYVASGPDSSRDTYTPELVGTHASHAWVSAFCGDWGWIEVDPTNDLVISDQHVVLGWGRDFEDVSPIRGVTVGGGRHEVSVEVAVEPVSA